MIDEDLVVGSDVENFTFFCKSSFDDESAVPTAAVILAVSFTFVLSIFIVDAAALRGFSLYDGTNVDLFDDVELPLLAVCLAAAAKEDVFFLGAVDAAAFDDDC
mmetsp:Transcript_12601/g.21432  ORF Transcript_12601/g.21432 Transcript_12601/m.21432 type:complete len:104 (+) Transcript_12601:2178-2489(+)